MMIKCKKYKQAKSSLKTLLKTYKKFCELEFAIFWNFRNKIAKHNCSAVVLITQMNRMCFSIFWENKIIFLLVLVEKKLTQD